MNSPNNNLVNLQNLRREDLTSTFARYEFPAAHSKTLFRNIYKKTSFAPWQNENTFPEKLKTHLNQNYYIEPLKISSQRISGYDDSVKFLFELDDKLLIETVLMPEKSRLTLCVSSQVGCAQGCVFCHTGRMGLSRNLTASEIVGQVSSVQKWIAEHPQWPQFMQLNNHKKISNVVFMGMGEPLDNVQNVSQALFILTDPFGFNLSKKKISISTAGHLDGLKSLLQIHPDAALALSVHSPFEIERSKILPINKIFPLHTVLSFLKAVSTTGILIQYTLISNVNDSPLHALELVKILAGMNVKINLIPLNPIEPSRLTGSGQEKIQEFRKILYDNGLRTMIRYSKGQDILGGCGQLASKF